MSLDYDDIERRARDQWPFSNGTEFYEWEENWCGRCLHDAPHRNMGKGSGCPILLVALAALKTPVEWLEQPPDELGRVSLQDRYHCVHFKAPGGGGRGSGEPRPKPEPSGMDGLFDRPERAVRMYVQPQPAEVTA